VRVKGLTGGSVARTVLTGILTLCLCAALGCSGSSSASSSAERVSGGEVAACHRGRGSQGPGRHGDDGRLVLGSSKHIHKVRGMLPGICECG